MCCNLYGGGDGPDDGSEPSLSKSEAWAFLFLYIGIAFAAVGVSFGFLYLTIRCLLLDCHEAFLSGASAHFVFSLCGVCLILCLILALCPAGVRLLFREIRKCLRRLREPD